MNSSLATTLSRERPEGALSFLAARSKSSARSLAPSINDVLMSCSEIVSKLVSSAIEIRTAAEFAKFCERAVPKYVALNLAMSQVATALVARPVLERLTRESISEMEADFRDKAVDVFGVAVRDQALFTVWTLRKISELVSQIVAAEIDPSKKAEDNEYCTNFNVAIFVAHFALDCLQMAMDTSRPIYPEVQEKLTDHLRAMVNAYAWARRGLAARISVAEAVEAPPALDDEDRALMDASFDEMSFILDGEEA